MAEVIKEVNLEHEGRLGSVSSAGWRLLVEDTVSPAGGAEATYTVTRQEAKRLLCLSTDNQLDIRVDLNETATATSLPLLPDQYVILSVEKGDVVHFFNTSGAPVDVFVVELR